MPLRTRLFCAALDRFDGQPIVGLDLPGIRRNRAKVAPAVPPFTWITGPVLRDVRREDTSFPARDGREVPLRVYRPARSGQPLPVVVFFHGGGWVLGSTRMYDPLCTFLAHDVGAVVVSVDYRLAPEHRAPTAVQDCVDSVRWIAEHAQSWGGNGSRLAVSGDSAGGNLSAVVCQVIRDEGGPAIAHQALMYPATDATMSQPSIAEHADAPILTRAKINVFLEHYLGPLGLSAGDPLVSPLWATSHAGLPPALVQTADLDPLRDEGTRYAERLAAAGVPVRHTNYVGAPHGFASFPGATTIGRQHRAELAGQLRRYLHP
ncbi:MAG TPA: alpha/beta hydrolase [Dermatophilaceae bacterium]|jgi:acetyl esterase